MNTRKNDATIRSDVAIWLSSIYHGGKNGHYASVMCWTGTINGIRSMRWIGLVIDTIVFYVDTMFS